MCMGDNGFGYKTERDQGAKGKKVLSNFMEVTIRQSFPELYLFCILHSKVKMFYDVK